MSFYKFKRGDILFNTFTARPEYNFFIYNQKRYLKNKNVVSGAYSSQDTNVPPGYVNLYELNVNRASDNLIYPWVYANQSEYFRLSSMTSGSQKASASLTPAVEVTGSYPLSSSISYYYFAGSDASSVYKLRLESLRNTINYYKNINPHYTFSGSLDGRIRDLSTENMGMITIPAVIHGQGLKKGSLSLKYYVSGALQAELTDENQRGQLVQASGTVSSNDGKTAGIVLYNERVIVLTGSWNLNASHQEAYGPSTDNPKWIYFGSSMSGSVTSVSSSYTLDFKATEKIPNITMLTYANKGELNFSNNPTFISSSKDNTPLTGSIGYFEQTGRAIKNIVSSSYTQSTGSFEKITYITKVGIYDKYKNLIGIMNLASPVRKREQDSYTLKLKLDM